MIVDGRVVRIEVKDSLVATDRGARVETLDRRRHHLSADVGDVAGGPDAGDAGAAAAVGPYEPVLQQLGDGGMRVCPCTAPMIIPRSSGKQ